jgi:hypothetical protein
MKTQTITKAVFGMILAITTQASYAGDTYQYKVLFNPSETNLASEKRGRVMIYDGMTEEEVDFAMEHQFDRIENMMFINTKRRTETGEYVEDDDDC